MNVITENIPDALKNLPQWVCWRYETRQGEPKPTKVPYDPRGGRAATNDPSTWVDFETALAAYPRGKYSGIGFMLSLDAGIVGVDLDNCITDNGEVNEFAQRAISELNTYTEITPSGHGLRLFCFGHLPPEGRKKGNVEFYDSLRFLTVTGQHFAGPDELVVANGNLQRLHNEIFPPQAKKIRHQHAQVVALSDSELFDRMYGASNGDAVKALYEGNVAQYGDDESAADSALCAHLRFWCQGDMAEVDRLFRQSGLMRPKWDQRRAADGRTYGQLTLDKVDALGGEVWGGEEVAGRAGIGGENRQNPNKAGFAGFAGSTPAVENNESEGSAGFAGTSGRAKIKGKSSPPVEEESETQEFTNEWDGPPRPIDSELMPVEKLTRDHLPTVFRDWLVDIAERMSVPLEYPASAALVALSAVIGRHMAICPKRYDDWTVVPNLWGMIVGPPGLQKTPSTEEAMKPLKRLEAEAAKTHQDVMKSFESELLVSKMKSKAAQANMEKTAKSGKATDEELHNHARAITAAEDSKMPPQTRYISNDSTIEALGMVLKDNPNGILIQRDEISTFFKNFERSGHEADRGFFLEGWSGTGSMMVDRVARGLAIYIPCICLSIYGTIQPGVLSKTIKGASGGEGADGLIQRFQVMFYPDSVPYHRIDRRPDTIAKEKAHTIYNNIAKGYLIGEGKMMGAVVDQTETNPMPFVRFDDEAQEFFNEWLYDLEANKLRGHESPIIQSHLAKYRSLMPSLALIFHIIEVSTGEAEGPVSLRAARLAAVWCQLLESHARRCYQMAFDGDQEAAQRLGERLKNSLPNPFQVRQVVKKGWSGLTTPDDVNKALMILEDRGWVQAHTPPVEKQGGRPTTNWHINPVVRED